MSQLVDVLLWLGGSAARYWTVAWGLFGVWLLSVVLPAEPGSRWRRWNHPVIHAGLTLLMLLAFRWPGITDNFQLANPDESQFLAGALTLSHHGRYWDVVDCHTSGPLNVIPLALPGLLGWPIDYTSARCVGLLLLWGSCIFAWLIFARVAGDRAGRLLAMPMVCWSAFTVYSDFVQYSSEQVPVFLCSLAAWLAVTALPAGGSSMNRFRLALAGLVLGLVPFAKMQAAPFTLCIGGWVLWAVLRRSDVSWPQRFAAFGWLIGGTSLALGLVLLSVLCAGELADFYTTYWLSNFEYAASRSYPWTGFFGRLVALVTLSRGFGFFFYPALVLVAAGLAAWRWIPRPTRGLVGFGAVLFVTSLVVVAAPGREFQHYLQFLLFPTTLFGGLLFGGLYAGTSPAGRRAGWLLCAFIIGVGPQIYYRCDDWNPYLGHLPNARANAVGPVAQQILVYARPGDTLVVWGWMPTFHVQTQLPQGTRDAHVARQISSNPLQSYFQQRYLRDLEKNRPALLVDAVGEQNFGYQSRAADGNENVPWLSDFVRAHYVLAADIETSRIYVRKDRWTALNP